MPEVVFYRNGPYLEYVDPTTGQLTQITDRKVFRNGEFFELEDPVTKILSQISRYFSAGASSLNIVTYLGSPVTYQGSAVTYGS